MAAAACCTWNSKDDPPVIVPSIQRWSMPRYSDMVTGVVDHHPAAARRHVAVDVGLGHAAVLEHPLHGERVVLDPVEVGGDG